MKLDYLTLTHFYNMCYNSIIALFICLGAGEPQWEEVGDAAAAVVVVHSAEGEEEEVRGVVLVAVAEADFRLF